MFRSGVFRRALRDSLPVILGYLTMGFAAGVLLAVQGGVPWAPFWAALTSATCVSGTLQFLIVKPIAELAPLLGVAGLTLAINFRYALYGFAFLEKWRSVPLLKKVFMINMLTDENFALASVAPYEDPKRNLAYCFALSVINPTAWMTGVTSGAIAGSELPIPSKGIEFAMVALFLVIFTDLMRGFCARRKAA